jgi:hypothetical protein
MTARFPDLVNARTNPNNVNKTWALLQITGDKDEPNIVFYEPTLDTCTLYIYIYLRLFTNTHLYESIMSNPSNVYLSPFTKS